MAIRDLIRAVAPQPLLNWNRRRYHREVSRIGRDSANEWVRRSSYIDGWFYAKELDYLWELGMARPGGNVLEIGSWKGKSACVLAGTCKQQFPGTKVFCVDPFDASGPETQKQQHQVMTKNTMSTFENFRHNAQEQGFYDTVVPIATRSDYSLPHLGGKFGLIFVDGDHSYGGVKTDVELAGPQLAPGGILVLHDSDGRAWPDVHQYVESELRKMAQYVYMGRVETLTAFRKVN